MQTPSRNDVSQKRHPMYDAWALCGYMQIFCMAIKRVNSYQQGGTKSSRYDSNFQHDFHRRKNCARRNLKVPLHLQKLALLRALPPANENSLRATPDESYRLRAVATLGVQGVRHPPWPYLSRQIKRKLHSVGKLRKFLKSAR